MLSKGSYTQKIHSLYDFVYMKSGYMHNGGGND